MSRRCEPLRIVQLLVLIAALALSATPVFADVGNDGVFEIDAPSANVIPNGNGDDWQTLFTCILGGGCTPSGQTPPRSIVTDPAPQTIFTGGGSKDNNDITQWQWRDGNVPDKDDLITAFAAVYNVGGSQRLYFGADRLAVNGDAQIGFWFFLNDVRLGTDGTFVDGDGNPATRRRRHPGPQQFHSRGWGDQYPAPEGGRRESRRQRELPDISGGHVWHEPGLHERWIRLCGDQRRQHNRT
jgi:hypothetical protein